MLSLLQRGLCYLIALFKVFWWRCAAHRPDRTLVCCVGRRIRILLYERLDRMFPNDLTSSERKNRVGWRRSFSRRWQGYFGRKIFPGGWRYSTGFLSLSSLQREYNPGFLLWDLAALPQSPLHTKKMLRVASVCSGSDLLMVWWDLGSTRNMRCKASCISLWNFSIFSQLAYIPWEAQLTCPCISCMLIITSYLRNGNLHLFFSLIPIFSRKVLSSESGWQDGTGHSFELVLPYLAS